MAAFMRWVLTTVVGGFRCLPEGLAVRLGLVLGWLFGSVLRHRRRLVISQLTMAFGQTQSPAWIAAVARAHYRHLGLLCIELLRLPRTSREAARERVIFQGEEHLQAALAQGKGVFLLTGHLGNWEMIGLALVAHGITVHAVGKEMKSQPGEMLRRMIRDENGVHSISRHGSVKEILTALRNRETVAFLLDQNMVRDEGVFVPFFGVPACTSKGLAVLAERTGAPVLYGAGFRDDDQRHFHLVIQPPLYAERVSDDPAENVRHNTQRFTAALEDLIRLHPEQWMWIHKRWRTRPLDEAVPPITY